MKHLAVLIIVASMNLSAIGQESPSREPDFSNLIDNLTGLQDDEAAYEEAYENLMQLMAHPLDLNIATPDELRQLYLLSDAQIQSLMTYRETNGKLISLYELQAVPDLDLLTIRKLLPFVTVADPGRQPGTSLFHRILKKDITYLITRFERTLETKKGFAATDDSTKQFTGSQDKVYIRFRNSRPGDFSFGFTGEKDAGEQLQWNPSQRRYGADFISYHAQILNKGKLKNLIIGDYQCQSAQGLVLGNAFGLGKGAETITTVRRNNLGILPYTSVNEGGFYRGVAGTVQLHRNFSVTGFYSSILRDASLLTDTLGQSFISALQYSGMHRNLSELDNRKKVREKSGGAVLNVRLNTLETGLIVHHISFDEPVQKQPSAYNQFTFQGKENTNLGGYLNYTVNNFTFFSEGAKSISGGTAIVAGMLGSLHPNFDMAMVFRKFDRNFYSFYANPFSENTSPQNETGFYWGWKYRWNRRYSMSGYVDQFRFPWLAFRRYAPGYGNEWLLRFNYQPNRKTLLFMQVREESKPRNVSGESNLYTIAQGRKRNFWMAAQYGIGEHLKFKSRFQYSTYSTAQSTTEGLALLQDVSLTAGRFQLTARHALFDTDDFDNRQYVYENDVWLAFSLPAYDGRGVRNYVLLEYKVNKHLSLWFRYARTRYTNREAIGTGLDEIAGNTKNDLKFQALFKF